MASNESLNPDEFSRLSERFDVIRRKLELAIGREKEQLVAESNHITQQLMDLMTKPKSTSPRRV